jgi:hypothetical protein
MFKKIKTAEQLKKEDLENKVNMYEAAVDEYVESVAMARGYKNAAKLMAYLNSTIPEWATDASIFIEWQDKVWVKTIKLLDSVKKEDKNAPKTADAFIQKLPTIQWESE